MKNINDNSCTANTLDWNPLADLTDTGDIAEAASPFLETEQYSSHTEYDALNRPVSLTTPDGSVNLPTYNEAGLLDKVQARLRGASVEDATPFVTNINYDAKGQRELVEYANGVYTKYTYDPLTFRVIRIHTIRTKDNACLQDLNYTYDPVGNITELRDNAQKTTFYDNARVEPVNHYEYDALYRLIHAEGREHAGQNPNAQPGHHNPPIINTPHPNDVQAMRNYTEDYAYDEVGNIKYMDHKFANGGWKRNYEYEELSNRLESTSLPGDDPEGPYGAPYSHDEHGNMTRMLHLPEMCWDFKDQMCQVDLDGGGTAYYVYDAGGQRARKVHEHNGSTVEERIYLGGCEICRKHNGSGLTLERETLHIMDDQQRIALVETKTCEDGLEVPEPDPLVRYQLNNHLGSSSLELDENASVISYEEYYPYGSTSYQAVDKEIKAAAKRYRYTGKERDDETGLYYYGARYYAAWLGRWVSCDPIGISSTVNLYEFTRSNPIRFIDPQGTDAIERLEELRQNIHRGKREKYINQIPQEADIRKNYPGTYCPQNMKCGSPIDKAQLRFGPESKEVIGFYSRGGDWTHYYNRKGQLLLGSELHELPLEPTMFPWEYINLARSTGNLANSLFKKGVTSAGRMNAALKTDISKPILPKSMPIKQKEIIHEALFEAKEINEGSIKTLKSKIGGNQGIDDVRRSAEKIKATELKVISGYKKGDLGTIEKKLNEGIRGQQGTPKYNLKQSIRFQESKAASATEELRESGRVIQSAYESGTLINRINVLNEFLEMDEIDEFWMMFFESWGT